MVWDVTVVDTLADSYLLPLKWVANANIANIVQSFRQTTCLKV
jgi:hypothetical protein